jgi:hypothetical protein
MTKFKKSRTENRIAGHSVHYSNAGVSCFYDSDVLNSSFVHLMKFSAKNPAFAKRQNDITNSQNMDNPNKTIIEYYIFKNLPINHDFVKLTSMIVDLLDEEDRVVYYIPGNKLSSRVFFTLKKIIIAQRFDGEWGGDIHLPYEEINHLKIQRQNKLFFIKLDLMVTVQSIKFYIKKTEADSFKKLMWNMFKIR